jgi:hypothetical protein
MNQRKGFDLFNSLKLIAVESILHSKYNQDLSKLSRIYSNFESIKMYIESHENSIFTVTNHMQIMGILISTTIEINTHTKYYKIIISESLETHKILEIFDFERLVYQTRRDF